MATGPRQPESFEELQRRVRELEAEVGRLRSLATEERHSAEAALRTLLEGATWTSVGAEFFAQLVERLTTSLGVTHAFVAELVAGGDGRQRARTLAAHFEGAPRPSFEYAVEGSPCEGTVGGGLCHYPRDVRERFPEDRGLGELGVSGYLGRCLYDHDGGAIGLLVVMDDRPMDDVAVAAQLLDILSGRATAELRRLRTERALRESEQRLRALVDAMPVLCDAFDEHGNVLYWNAECERVTGYAREEIVGQPGALERLYPDERYRAWVLESVARSWGEFRSVEFDLTCKSGERRTIAWSNISRAVPIPGWATWAVGVDVTGMRRAERERRALEQQVLHAQKLESVGRLAGGVAHDFNNLLTAITGNLDLALADLSEADPLVVCLGEIRAAVGRATDLTRQLLAFSRKQAMRTEVVDLGELVHDLHRMLGRLLGEDIGIELAAERGRAVVKADAGQLEQVVVNLAVNARDAMPGGGSLTIAAAPVELDEGFCALHPGTAPGAWVKLSVRDTGGGMEKQVQSRIFEPFFTTRGESGGTGLGLSTVYGIVRQHGGVIEVRSTPGTGTAFDVYLPRAEDDVLAPPRWRAPRGMPRGSETVLVVEDEAIVRALVVRVLTRLGYRVLEADGGEAALALARRHPGPIHLLLTDVVMPGMNGRELAEQLALEQAGVRVLYMSGYPTEIVSQRRLLGADVRFLQKPTSPLTLARAVRAELDGER